RLGGRGAGGLAACERAAQCSGREFADRGVDDDDNGTESCEGTVWRGKCFLFSAGFWVLHPSVCARAATEAGSDGRDRVLAEFSADCEAMRSSGRGGERAHLGSIISRLPPMEGHSVSCAEKCRFVPGAERGRQAPPDRDWG